MKEWMEPINSELPLSKAFNRIISDLELLRIMTNPRIFSDSTDKEAPFRMHNYYLTVLWERWLHGVFNRLLEWADTISTYFDEYNGSWEYYALSKRLEFINEYGSNDDDDYDSDDTITTFADRELFKVSEMVKAMDNGQLVYTIAQIMESLTKEIESIAKSEMAFYDNHNVLNAILNDASSILHLHLDKTRFFKFSNSGPHKHATPFISN